MWRTSALAGRGGERWCSFSWAGESVSSGTATGQPSPQLLMIAAPSLTRMNLARRSPCSTTSSAWKRPRRPNFSCKSFEPAIVSKPSVYMRARFGRAVARPSRRQTRSGGSIPTDAPGRTAPTPRRRLESAARLIERAQTTPGPRRPGPDPQLPDLPRATRSCRVALSRVWPPRTRSTRSRRSPSRS